MDADEDYWDSFPSDGIDLTDEPDGPVPTPATPPATQPRPLPPIQAVSPPPPSESADLKTRPYYNQILDTLKRVFGLPTFRPKQLDAICAAMDGRDVFVLFPTGSGKSLTFQLPAVCQKGVTIVVSPLLSLMRDQVQALQKIGVHCALINGDMKESERTKVKTQLRSRDKPNLLYVTPEQLQMSGYMQSTLQWLYEHGQLMRFVIDEAHCISDWGRRFRDSYTHLTELRKSYPKVPISALTATANAEVVHDIISRLDIPNCVRLKLSFNRTNLDYEVRPKKSHKACVDEIAALIQTRFPTHTGIIYCHSRDKCEEVAKELRERYKLNAKHFHAGLADCDKRRVQREWSEGEVLIIVATVAFGMGIDKADVRYVIHHTLPATLANYYQETGRAGRDGRPAHCILFYSYGDVTSRLEMIRKDEKPEEERRWMEEDFWSVVRYCSNDVRCRRQQVLDFFGEKFDPALCRDLCDNCRDKTPVSSENYTEDAIRAVALFENLSTTGTPITKSHLVNALRGSKLRAMVDKGFVNVDGYGSCRHLTQQLAERLIDEMLFQGVLTTVQQKTYQDYTSSYLKASHPCVRTKP
ncbi:ATP-dependent RNA helicase [Dichomitus squalens]|uniref:ATP-dependent DNA helicase n=1 Tax=Dichomitus squalens TaxID=114155 RepID=A0A4Q9MMQ5_9APHY|nr:ATP-dependent RNA helicase [Dichomitus squalens]